MHAGEQCTASSPRAERGPLAVRLVDVAQLVDAAVAGPAIGDDPRPRLDVRSDKGVERVSRTVTKKRHPAAPIPSRLLPLDSHAHQYFLAPGPSAAQSGSSPPKKISSTSTMPVRRSLPGWTRTERSRCSIAHAVWYEPISSPL